MSVTTDTVITVLKLEDGEFNAKTRANEAQFTRSKQREAIAAEQSERRIRASSSAIRSSLLASASALAAGFTVGSVTNLADSYTRFTNQLKLAGLEGRQLATTQDALFASAQRYGVQLEGLGTLYGRVSQAGKELGATNDDLLKFTNGVAAAIKIQGATAESVQGALLQLSQALGGTTVRAEEYNSINEGARPILTAVANGSDRFKGSVNALRSAVIAGTVSSKEFYQAFLAGSAGLEAQATKANLTIGASLTILNNALGQYIGQTDASLSATQRASAAIQALANNLDVIVPVIGVLVTLVGSRYVAAAISATAATLAQSGATALAAQNARAHAAALAVQTAANARLTASGGAATAALRFQAATTLTAAGAARGFGASLLALAGGPIGVAVLAVAALAGGIGFLIARQTDAAVATRAMAQVQRESGGAATQLEGLIRSLTNANDADTASIRRNIAALVDRQRLFAQMKRNELLAEQAVQRERQRDINRMAATSGAPASAFVDAYGRSTIRPEGLGPNGNPIDIGVETEKVRVLRAEAEAAETQYQSMVDTVAEATGPGNIPVTPVAETGGGKGGGPTGPTAEELARMRERLTLQQEVDLARARGDEDAERAAQRRLDIMARTEELERAQIANAEARATEEVDALATIEAANREIEKGLAAAEKREDRRQRTADAVAAARQREQDALDRQLDTQLELARIEGNVELVRLLERELELRRRIAQLGPNATPEEVAGVVNDQNVINDAEDRAIMREGYREYARVFVDAVTNSDSLGDFFKNLGVGLADKLSDRFAERLENDITDLLELIFSQLTGGGGGAGGGGGFDLGSLIQSGIKAVFGGGRSLGGPVMAGQTVRVNENTANSEYFTPAVAGYVTPTAQQPARRGGMGNSFTYAPSIDARGAGPREVDELKGQLARDRRSFAARVRGVVNDGLATDRIGAPPWK